MKLLIIGHGRHGKDTAAEMFKQELGLTWSSSSWIACEHFIFETLKDVYDYKTLKQCYADRHNRRKEWYDLIAAFNKEGHELGEIILKKTDIYVGLRSIREFNVFRHRKMFDLAIWIDRSERLKPESLESLTITKYHCDIIIDNNLGLQHLEKNIKNLCKVLK